MTQGRMRPELVELPPVVFDDHLRFGVVVEQFALQFLAPLRSHGE